MKRVLAVLAGIFSLAVAAPALAVWSDTPVSVSGSTLSAHTVLSPTSADCSGALLAGTVSWDADPRYDYEVTLRRVSNGAVVSTRQVTGSDNSVSYLGLASFGLVVGAGTVDFQVEITAYLAAAPSWRAAAPHIYQSMRVLAILVGATVSCTNESGT